jgi:dTDP-4-amino-4,6-dideoxygalactose transaminase
MTVPLNDTRRRFADRREQLFGAWTELLDRGVFVGGPPIELFERRFAEYCGAANCVALANGTDALEFALRALEVGDGDEVITVANAGGYTTAACHVIGAVPVYVDVNDATCQLSVTEIEAALSSKTRALVITHLYGFMNDVSAVRAHLDALRRDDVVIIEDCAQAHGAAIAGRTAGSLGDAAAFSFYPTKNLGAIGDAGAVLCRNPETAQRVRQLRQYGWSTKYLSTLAGGRNSRMDPLQAIVLQQQLDGLMTANRTRREICTRYGDNLPSGWAMVGVDDSRFVAHLAVAIAPDAAARERALRVLTDRKIGYDVHYPTLDCDQPAWYGKGRSLGNLAASRLLTRRVLSLPCFAELTPDELEQVINAIHAFQ